MNWRDDEEVDSASDESECEIMLTLEDASDVEYAVNDESLVIKRSLNVQVSEENVEQQTGNIFHTRCHIKNKVCSIIINNGNCINVANTTLIRELNSTTNKHATLYKLQWLNECGEVGVTKQVLILFLVGRYNDEVYVMLFLCMVHTCCWGDLGNLIRKPSMMVLKISTHQKKIGKHTCLNHCHLNKYMKIN